MDFYTIQLGWYFQKKFIEFCSLVFWYWMQTDGIYENMTLHCSKIHNLLTSLCMYQFYWFLSTMKRISMAHTTFFILLQWTFVKPNWNITNLPFFFHFSNFNFSSSKIKTKKNTKIKKFADFRSFWFHTHTLKSNDKK